MDIPTLFGWFHLLWLLITIILMAIIYKYKSRINEKLVYGLYGFGSLIFELIKQYMWNFNFVDGKLVFSYGWYNFPFQLCSTPMYVAIILFFLKESKLKDLLINYLSYFTIISALAVIVYPGLVFCEYTLVNIQTMYLHCGSLILSMYLIFNNKEDKSIKGVIKGLKVFIVMVSIALILNIVVYNAFNLVNEPGQVFNMFYISPYYDSWIIGFSYLWKVLPYPLFLLIYVLAFVVGALIINRILSIKKDN